MVDRPPARRADDTARRLRYARRVTVFRRLVSRRSFAVLLCGATLLLRVLVPSGYMVGSAHGRLTIELCSGVAAMPMASTMAGMAGHMPGHDGSREHGKAEMPCAFSALSAAALSGADPIQLAALAAFVVAAGLRPLQAAAAIGRPAHLRPPLRGPPATP